MSNAIYYDTLPTEREFYAPASSVFSKSNYLIQARYNYTLLCNQILALSLLRAKKTGDTYTAQFSVMEIRKLLKKDYKQIYNQIKEAGDKMTDTKICLENPEKNRFEYHQLIPTFEYDHGECTVVFNPRLNHIVGNLTSNFVVLNIQTLADFASVNSFRLYETLKSKAYYPKTFKGERTGKFEISFSLAELKVMLNAIDINRKEIASIMNNTENPDYDKVLRVAEEIYEKEKDDPKIKTADKFAAPKWRVWKDFNNNCLKTAVEEINEKTELLIEYDTYKKYRAVAGINFYVTDTSLEKKREEEASDVSNNDRLLDVVEQASSIIKEKMSLKDLMIIARTADGDIEKIKKAYDVAKKSGANDLLRFMISAIKNNFELPDAPVKCEKENSFHFENKRDYDYDELEKQIINR